MRSSLEVEQWRLQKEMLLNDIARLERALGRARVALSEIRDWKSADLNDLKKEASTGLELIARELR